MSVLYQSFSLKLCLRVTTIVASTMSSTTRTLRSKTLVKAENETDKSKEIGNGPTTSRYFQKRPIIKQTNALETIEKLEKGVKSARGLKSKPNIKNVKKEFAKSQGIVFKTEDAVIAEALNDNNFASTSDHDSNSANLQRKVENIGSKGKAKKTAIKSEPISPDSIKTEIVSDEELDFENGNKNKISPQKKKLIPKSSVKTEPKSSAVGHEELTAKISPARKRRQVQKVDKASKIKTEPMLGLEDETKQELITKASIKTEPNSSEVSIEESTAKISPQKRKQAQKGDKATKIKTEPVQDIEDVVWRPDNWRVVLDNILEMRKWQTAPVDMMGCEECPEKDVPPEVFRYQTLISVMLSSQTRDEVTYAATQRLIGHGLTVDSILNTSDEKIGELIYPAGFWKSKVKYIRNTTQILKDQYNGDIPCTFKDLCKLPGVGPKMANIVMSVGWNETVGIAVDTHVHRISNRLGWVPKPTKDPEQTRKALEAWLPKEHWDPINITLVGFGQTICRPIGPVCHKCLNLDLCPFGTSVVREGIKKSPKK